MSPAREGWENWDFSAWKREGFDLTVTFHCLKGDYSKDGERLFTRECSGRIRLLTEENKFRLDIRKVFALFPWLGVTVFVPNLWERLYAAQEGSRVTLNWVFHNTDKQRSTGCAPCNLAPKCQAQVAWWHPVKDAREQNSAGQGKVVCCWLSEKPSDAFFLILTA